MSSHATEVVIIGAGAAGLAAARLLADSGRQVIVVEARDRIGGRIFTRHTETRAAHVSVPVELGAEFVHGLPAVSWSLIREAQLPCVERQGKPYCFDGQLLEPCDDRLHAAFSVLEGMESFIDRRPPEPDLTFEDYLRAAAIEPASAERAAAYVEGFNAADRNLVSATALVRQQRAEDRVEGDRLFHLRSGYDALPRYLAAQLSRAGGMLLLDSPVRDIEWSKGCVSVRGRGANGAAFSIDARQAVITLPLGVLQAAAVTFNPAPADLAGDLRGLIAGRAERITLLFNHRFWNEKSADLGFLLAPGQLIPTWWTTAPESLPMITGWAAGAAIMARWQRAQIGGQPALLPVALQTLSRIFGLATSELERSLVSAHHHNWQTDAFSRGAYSYVAVGGLAAARKLSTPVEGTLFFAGEHTDIEDQWGTVHAALASGLRAAHQVLAQESRRA